MPGDYTYDNWADASQPNKNARRCARMTGNAIWTSFDCTKPSGQGAVCELPREANPTCDSDLLQNEDNGWDETYPAQPLSFLDVGKFKGMNASPGVTNLTNLDPFFGQYFFEIKLDEVELRSRAGKLKGTVGVEHTVDTFLGLANFRPTGIAALDTFATQTAIHLEKTSFFSVSTHGVNEYTFLEYVNMRLVMILNEDADNSGASEAGDRTVRTNRTGNAAYVQVTFTMGEQYQPNLDSGGLVPLDSVRAGMGTFFDDVNLASGLEHLCVEYVEANATIDESFGLTGYTGGKDTYNTLVGQTCSPQSAMCASPTSVPDQFVSFNIPLGFEVFDGMASNDLSNNIFVEFVVNALDTTATGAPNSGDDPMQMKTTLTASIPIVDGGVNIFCDGVVAKTDLKDVADVDIVVGSAVNASELTRLRILEDIASTDLSSVSSQRIDTASIESALMTLVLKGNHSYFLTGASNTGDYTMELDDVITLHMMVDGDGTASNSKEAAVLALMAQPGDDNQDSNGLDTDGYALNGAFYFTIERDQNKAHLEPSDLLLAQCPFNPPRPAANSLPLESCILRRDVRNRIYPNRQGAPTTAMEIVAATVPVKDSTKGHIDGVASAMGPSSDESTFLTNILGASDYTRELAVSFARAIHERYELNGRYRRAFWINPGYEWTPTQTAGRSIFSVSQKIYLFALISLDENWTRRRMLLQTARSGSEALEEQSAGMNAASLAFDVTPKSMLASSFDVPVDRVATFAVEMQLTEAEACMSAVDLQASLRATFEDYLTKSASGFHTVQVTKMEVDMGGHQCASNRRSLRKLLAGFSAASAVVEMLVVFKEGSASTFNDKLFAEQAGITSVRAVDVSPKVSINADYKCETNCGPSSGQGQNSDSDLSSSNTAMIAGIAGGVGGALVVGGAVAMLMRKKDDEPIPAVQTINVNDLKAQLADEV